MQRLSQAGIAMTAFPASVAAHPIAAMHGELAVLPWTFEPWVVTCLVVVAVGYLAGMWRLDASARRRLFAPWRQASFAGAMATLIVALLSPLDALGAHRFSAHMLQHLLLMLIAAPLFVWSRPAMAWLWAFPLPARRAIGHAWSAAPGLRSGVRILMAPLAVWLLSSFVLWFWHLPGPYGWALDNEAVHALEHLCLFGTALAFWSLVLEPSGRRRLGHGETLLFVATFGVQNGLLGAILTFAGRPLYAAYAQHGSASGLNALQDQQLAGLLMWIPAGLVHLSTLVVLFASWLNAAEARALATGALRASLAVALVAVVAAPAPTQAQAVEPVWQVVGGNAQRGRALIGTYGCGACHAVPGVRGADGNVGPPLTRFGDRTYIAGMLHNSPDNLIRWLRAPQSVIPGNAMPDMGVTDRDARDLAAYLYTLR